MKYYTIESSEHEDCVDITFFDDEVIKDCIRVPWHDFFGFCSCLEYFGYRPKYDDSTFEMLMKYVKRNLDRFMDE